MKEKDLIAKLDELRNLPAENEIVEFKEAKTNYDLRKLGKYFSALSNEANLKNAECAWLVFGVEDKKKSIVGTTFRTDYKDLQSLKKEIADKTTNRITFIEIYPLNLPEGRVIMFQIPAAPKGIPTDWEGHWYARNGESSVALNTEKLERIRKQVVEEDWSAAICPDATIEDLEPLAIAKARENFKVRNPRIITEIDSWNDEIFLNKAKLTIKNKITRTAIILLGKEESEHFVSPADIKIRWILMDSKGDKKDWKIESCPFLLAVDNIYAKIRNIRYRYMQSGTLFPDEVDRYEPFVIREALNNCIAHQDYSLRERIDVIEEEDQLSFRNAGNFIPGSIEEVINQNAPEPKYRNSFLVAAMVNLGMVDTIGSGIIKMFNFQRARSFPMPDYDFSKNRVKVTVIGKVLDMDYASILAKDNSLSLPEIMMLDKVQKKNILTEFEENTLKKKHLIEGRKPNYYISARIAQTTGQKAEYTKAKGFEKDTYFQLILNCIKQHSFAERKDIDALLWDVLPNKMTEKQKKTKINHLLTDLNQKKRIENIGNDFKSKWVLKDK
jgi:ATP-dependent DNA helicase RecG